MLPVTPLIEVIVKLVTGLVKDTDTIADTQGLDELRHEENKQEVSLRMAERQAKVAQELAIAERIKAAEEVEIDEFYEASGEGSVGGSYNAQGASVGVSAKGNRVTRRTYRFKGIRESSEVNNHLQQE